MKRESLISNEEHLESGLRHMNKAKDEAAMGRMAGAKHSAELAIEHFRNGGWTEHLEQAVVDAAFYADASTVVREA